MRCWPKRCISRTPHSELAPPVERRGVSAPGDARPDRHSPSRPKWPLFLLDPSPDRRQKLVDRLLADPRFGRNWGRYWRDVIMYRRSRGSGLAVARRPLEAFLTESLNRNLGWDQIAQAVDRGQGQHVIEDGPDRA